MELWVKKIISVIFELYVDIFTNVTCQDRTVISRREPKK
jgi:hypothetical protein